MRWGASDTIVKVDKIKCKVNIIIDLLMMGSMAFMVYIIYAQSENNKQLMYDLNVSQTAFKIQQNEIANGLCLKNLGALK